MNNINRKTDRFVNAFAYTVDTDNGSLTMVSDGLTKKEHVTLELMKAIIASNRTDKSVKSTLITYLNLYSEIMNEQTP